MPYVNCPRCGLSVTTETDASPWLNCPRCLGSDGLAIAVFVTQHPVSTEAVLPGAVGAASLRGGVMEQPEGTSRILIRHRSLPNSDVLMVSGEVDLATAGELDRRLDELESAGFQRLVLDLRNVAFMDSTGLTVVIAAELRARRHSRLMEIVTAEGQVQRLFELVGVGHQLAFASGQSADPRSGF